MTDAIPDLRRTLADTAFPDDRGLALPATRRALTNAQPAADGAGGSGDPAGRQQAYLRAVAALCADRLLVPVVATRIGESVVTGADKQAEMAVVLLQAADGRRAMVAFTGMDALAAWDAGVRPVPVTIDLAAKSARADGAAALLIDFAGPHPLVVDGEVLDQLALGRRLVELEDGGFGWAQIQPDDPLDPNGPGAE